MPPLKSIYTLEGNIESIGNCKKIKENKKERSKALFLRLTIQPSGDLKIPHSAFT
jgi:hypothetical protein